MGPAMLLWYEAELAYRRDGIKADWARSRSASRSTVDAGARRRPGLLGHGWRAAHGLRA